jgi:hypothetical protein
MYPLFEEKHICKQELCHYENIEFSSSCCIMVQFGVNEVIPEGVKTLLLAEIQSNNRQFPVSRFYSQLTAKQSQLEQCSNAETDGKCVFKLVLHRLNWLSFQHC